MCLLPIYTCSYLLYAVPVINNILKVLIYKKAKKLCHSLHVTHEGISHVKEFKINLLAHKYELVNSELFLKFFYSFH